MMYQGMVFGDVVAIVFFSGHPVVSELALVFSVSKPWYFMSIAFSFFMMLLLTTPSAVVLSVCIGVGGWGCPMYSSVCHAGTASQQLM